MKKLLADDEIIIQIIKGNEEAKMLLFCYYENYFRKLEIRTRQFRKNMPDDYDDIKQFMMINMENIIKLYDLKISSFYAFWNLLEYRHINGLYRSKLCEYEKEITKISLNNDIENSIKFSNNDFNIIKYYSLKEDYNYQLNRLTNRYGDEENNILLFWSRGYSYVELSNIFNKDPHQIAYIINKCMKYLKKKN